MCEFLASFGNCSHFFVANGKKSVKNFNKTIWMVEIFLFFFFNSFHLFSLVGRSTQFYIRRRDNTKKMCLPWTQNDCSFRRNKMFCNFLSLFFSSVGGSFRRSTHNLSIRIGAVFFSLSILVNVVAIARSNDIAVKNTNCAHRFNSIFRN